MSFSNRATAFSRVCRSARISSVLIVSMSPAGSTSPSTCTTSGSAKPRMTCAMASASRMLARNLLPRPSPSLAPRTMPAMSTNDTGAGRRRSLPKIAASRETRVGQVDDAHVRLDRRERVVRREHVVLGQGVEEGGLADIGQSDDCNSESHEAQSYRLRHATGPARPGYRAVRLFVASGRPVSDRRWCRVRYTPAITRLPPIDGGRLERRAEQRARSRP